MVVVSAHKPCVGWDLLSHIVGTAATCPLIFPVASVLWRFHGLTSLASLS